MKTIFGKCVKMLMVMTLLAGISLQITGCGSDSGQVQNNKKKTAVSAEPEKTAVSEKATATPVPDRYEMIFKKNVKWEGISQKIEILQNPEDVRDLVIKIEDQEVALERISIDAGYAHTEVKMADLTGDRKKEIILLLHGGASATPLEMQVLEQRKDGWKEIALPEELWNEEFVTLSQKKNMCAVSVKATGSRKKITLTEKQSDSTVELSYRICKLKGNRISVVYQIKTDSEPENLGEVIQELKYDKASRSFRCGKTKFLFK